MSGKRVLCISSGGGHWAELIRLEPALESSNTAFASTHKGYSKDIGSARYFTIVDANRNEPFRMFLSFLSVFLVVVRFRPQRIISTGALPGLFAMILGRVLFIPTAWVDSIANYDEISMSGRYARRFAQLYLTQWEHLVGENGPHFKGKVV